MKCDHTKPNARLTPAKNGAENIWTMPLYLFPSPLGSRCGGCTPDTSPCTERCGAFFVPAFWPARAAETSSQGCIEHQGIRQRGPYAQGEDRSEALGAGLAARDQFSRLHRADVRRWTNLGGLDGRAILLLSAAPLLVSDYPLGIVMTTLRSLPRNFISSRGFRTGAQK